MLDMIVSDPSPRSVSWAQQRRPAARLNSLEFGRRLRAARLASGITQEDLSRRANLSQNQVGMIENGKREPLLSTALAIAAALGVPLTSLIPD